MISIREIIEAKCYWMRYYEDDNLSRHIDNLIYVNGLKNIFKKIDYLIGNLIYIKVWVDVQKTHIK